VSNWNQLLIPRRLRAAGKDKESSRAEFDRIPKLCKKLNAARNRSTYNAAFEDPEPLVTVRIATYNRGDILFERTIPSIQAQTYKNFECIVVSDRCTDDTGKRVETLGDSRFRFVELAHRDEYPDDPKHRWMVAGSPAMNLGARLARGNWIAPLDDDDEFTPDHLEVLLTAARSKRLEMAYGNFLWFHNGTTRVLGRFPPEHGYFGMQSALYMSAIRMFEYETQSWKVDEPGDWNLCRRMVEAGVRIGYVNRVLSHIYATGPPS
jgi:glycosyltransferase involved in cell wall biosynthesis